MAFHWSKQQENSTEGIVSRITHDIVHAIDWIAGPGMTERDRVHREIFESRYNKWMDGGF